MSRSSPETETLKPCPFCGSTALIDHDWKCGDDEGYYEISCTNCTGSADRFIGVHSDCRESAVRWWNTRTSDLAQTPASTRVDAAAEYLVRTVERKLWGGIRSDGRAKDAGFEPFHYSQHSFSVNGNARQDDYRDVVREIARALSDTSTDRPYHPGEGVSKPITERSQWPAKGDLMTFLGKNGYPFELEEAKKIFVVGNSYEVHDCDVGDWHHSIQFVGVKGRFNGVMFERVADSSPVETKGA